MFVLLLVMNACCFSHLSRERLLALPFSPFFPNKPILVRGKPRPYYTRPLQADPSYSPALPPRYRNGKVVSAAPMGTAPMRYTKEGLVAWDEIWTDFCDLALAG